MGFVVVFINQQNPSRILSNPRWVSSELLYEEKSAQAVSPKYEAAAEKLLLLTGEDAIRHLRVCLDAF